MTVTDVPFHWGPQQQDAPDQLKQLLTRAHFLAFYNPNAST